MLTFHPIILSVNGVLLSLHPLPSRSYLNQLEITSIIKEFQRAHYEMFPHITIFWGHMSTMSSKLNNLIDVGHINLLELTLILMMRINLGHHAKFLVGKQCRR